MKDTGGVGAVGGQEAPFPVRGSGLEAKHIGKSHYAAAAVAAHHAAASVRIVELHPEVVVAVAGQNHEAVCAIFPAQIYDATGIAKLFHSAMPAVCYNEIVSCTRELVQHGCKDNDFYATLSMKYL